MTVQTSNNGYTKTVTGDARITDLVTHFSDDLSKNTLSDYTLGGDTNPVYDATEDAIKLADSTNADNKVSYAYKTIGGGIDESVWTQNLKIGSNDTSTDGRLFDFRLRSATDTDTYIAVYYDGTNIYLENVVDGTTKGTGNTAVALGNTKHKLTIITRMAEGHIYLFIDDVEYLDVSPTQLKRFFDTQIFWQSKHDSGEDSEIFVNEWEFEDAPTVNAPRSTPPGLLTSALRPAVEGTYWSDYECYWPNDANTTVEIDGGIYGNGIKRTYPLTVPSNDIYFYFGSGGKDLSNISKVRFVIEMSQSRTMYVNAYTGGGGPFVTLTGLIAGKKKIFEFDTSEWVGADWSDFDSFRFRTENPTASEYVIISDIQLLGGPEHDIRGQPYYSSPGIDDLDEWTLSGNTHPTWDSGNSCYSLEDATASDNASQMIRTIPFNPNGCFVKKFTYQLQADDDSTDDFKRLEFRIEGASGDEVLVYYTTWDSGVTWRWYIQLRSNGNNNYATGAVFAPDTNWHDVVVYFHKEYGFSFFIDGKILFSKHSISGTWTDWTQDYVTLSIRAQHDNGEKSHVHVKDIKVEPHPLDIDWFQSNPIEFLTDTLSPSGSEYMDGDWSSGTSIVSTGNPITNGKYARRSSGTTSHYIYYEPDSDINLNRFDTVRFWMKLDNITNITSNKIYLYDDVSGSKNFNEDLTISDVDTWTLFELPLSSFTAANSPSWGSIERIQFFISTSDAQTIGIDIYGLQFLSSEHEKEYFIPQEIQIGSSSGYGSILMTEGEKMRIYKLNSDPYGALFIDKSVDLDLLPLYGSERTGKYLDNGLNESEIINLPRFITKKSNDIYKYAESN